MSLVNGVGGLLGAGFQGVLGGVVNSVTSLPAQTAVNGLKNQSSIVPGLFGALGGLPLPQGWVEQKDEFVLDPSGDDRRANFDPSGDDITGYAFGQWVTLDPSGDDFTLHLDPSGDSVRIPSWIRGALGGLFGQGK